MQSDAQAIALPPLTHVGIVVKDVVKTSELLSSLLGVGSWKIDETAPKKEELIVGEPFRLKLAFGNLRETELELLQPLEGDSVWSQFIETNGEGVHHLCFTVPNWDEMVSKFRAEGGKMIVGGIYKGKRWCYFDTKPGGTVVELFEG